jgi:hypothetical protein
MKYLYDRRGEAVAAIESGFIYDLDGYARGFIQSENQVYRMDGGYVGQIHQDMVVDAFVSNPGSTSPPANPGRIPPIARIPGRGPVDYGYPSRIERLFE